MRGKKIFAALIFVLLISLGVMPAAAQKPSTTLVVTPSNLQGWFPFAAGGASTSWVADPGAPIGNGYFRFSIDPAAAGGDKVFLYAAFLGGTPALDLIAFSYSFYIDPTSTRGSQDFYINVYVDQAIDGLGEYSDCRYDYTPPATNVPGWHTGSFTNTTVLAVSPSGGAACPNTLAGLAPGDIISSRPGAYVVLNGGQSNNSDNGLVGGYDNVIIETASITTTYDFEPDALPDISLIKSVELFTDVDGDGQYDPGDTFNFAITVSYVSGATINGIVVADLLPAGVTLTSASTTQGTYDSTTGVWNGITLSNVDPTAVLNLMGTVNAGTEGQTITNTATITGSNPQDTNPANNSASAAFTVGTAPVPTDEPTPPPPPPPPPPANNGGQPQIFVFDPAISKLGTLLPGQVGITGEQVRWDVTVVNVGNANGDNVVITDTLPTSLAVERVEAPGAAINVSGQTVSVTYGVLVPGQSVSFQIFTRVLQGGAMVQNTACVTANNLATARCATASALGGMPGQLPSTGETPWWRNRVLLAGAALMLMLAGLLFSVVGQPKLR